jgi:NitT/TauT family transport system permease protein
MIQAELESIQSLHSQKQEVKMLPQTLFWRIAEEIPKPLNLALTITSLSLPILLWWLVSGSGAIDPKFLPTPPQVWNAFQKLLASGELIKDIYASLYRVFFGFFLSVLLSVPFGILMGTFASLRALLEPMSGFLRYMPAPAFIPLLILYLGIDETPKIVLIFIGTIFFNGLMVMDAVKFVPKELIETTYTLGGKRWQVLLRVITPYILPSVIDTCRVNMAAAWQLVIVSELIAATEGLGRRISIAGRFLRTDEIFVGLILIGLIGLAIDLLFRFALRVFCRWRT